MAQMDLPEWLRSLIIVGREDDDDKDDSNKDDDDAEDGDDDTEDEDKDKGDDDKDADKESDTEALKKALRTERQLRRKAEREAKLAKKQKSTEKEEKTAEETAEKLRKSEERTTRLAQGFLHTKVDDAIKAEATRLGFIDPTDALIDSVRKNVDADQDDDDPTDVDVDMDSVKDAVKDLADRKKHLLGEPGSNGTRSGGKFRKKGTDDKAGDKALTEHYPSLR